MLPTLVKGRAPKGYKRRKRDTSMDARTPTIDNPNLKEAVDMADITPVPSGVLLHEES